MPSAIPKMNMGVSAIPAATNQNCVSERLRIGMMSHFDQNRREKLSGGAIFNTQRPDSVVSSVTNTSDCSFFWRVFDMSLREMLNIVHVYERREAARPTIYVIMPLKLLQALERRG